MRILFIITGLGTGGAEMMLFMLLSRLDRTRFEPSVISLTTLGELGSRIEELGVPVKAVGMRRAALPSPRAGLRLVKMIKEARPDVVQTWMYHADLAGGLASRAAGVRAVAWGIHHTNLDADMMSWQTRVTVRACAALSRTVPRVIVTCAETAIDVHSAVGYDPKKFVVIPNGFDLERFRPDPEARFEVRAELGIAAGASAVGLVGRYAPLKNHQGFFRAAGLVHEKLPEAHFICVGTDVTGGNAAIVGAVRQAGISEVTHLLGRRADMPRIMASLDVLASSSHGEAFPNVLGEAMACEVPCAVTRVGDSAAIVGDEGRVVERGDMAGLARAMEDILRLPETERQALGRRCRERVAGEFELGAVTRRYEAVWARLAEAGRPASGGG